MSGISRDKELPTIKGEKRPRTEVELTERTLIVHIRGVDKFWALKSQLEIALTHVVGAEIDPTVVENWGQAFKGLPLIHVGWANLQEFPFKGKDDLFARVAKEEICKELRETVKESTDAF